jgi:hypothetical protein
LESQGLLGESARGSVRRRVCVVVGSEDQMSCGRTIQILRAAPGLLRRFASQ